MTAQEINNSITGEYYLRGVMETASGFQVNADSTFQFFFSQGALDRVGKGRWSLQDGKLILNSAPRPPKDFALLASKKIPGDLITVKITDRNKMILSYVDVSITANGKQTTRRTDSEGMTGFTKQPVSNISLLFRLCPERATSFSINDSLDNYFEFRFEPWIAEVFFDNFSLQLNGKDLTGAHPLLHGNTFSYEKR